METENCGTVFGTAELLENILSFLDIQDLLQARNVSDQWRAVAEWSLKRRLYARTEQRWYGFNISLWEESETFFYLDLRKRELYRHVPIASSVPPLPIPPDLHEEVYLQIGPAPTWRPGKSKRYPVVLSTLLKFDWCAGIQHLTLSGRTVSIREWNVIGRHLLSRFRRLKNLDLVLWSADEDMINGEWKDFEACGTSEVQIDSDIEEMDIQYVQLDYNSGSGKSQLKLDFLDMCPKLHTLYVNFAIEATEIDGSECLLSCKFFEVEGAAGRQVDCGSQFKASPEAIEAWMDELDCHLIFLKPSFFSFEINQFDYIARFPEVAASRLQRLKVRLNQDTDETASGQSLLKSLSRLPPLSSVTNLDLSIWTSTFSYGNAVSCPLLDEILSRTGNAENALSDVTTLNLEFLDSECFCRRPEGWRGKYNAELWEIVPKAMPNIELLFVHTQCLCFLERICGFEKLKHLVILNPDVWNYRMPAPPEAGVWTKFKALQTVSAQFRIWASHNYHDDETTVTQRNLLAAMATAPSLKVIRVFHPFRVPATMTEEDLLEDVRSLVPRDTMIEAHLMENIKPNKITLETLTCLVQNLPVRVPLEVEN